MEQMWALGSRWVELEILDFIVPTTAEIPFKNINDVSSSSLLLWDWIITTEYDSWQHATSNAVAEETVQFVVSDY